MPLIGARLWFAATAGCALAGVVISAVTAANDAHEHFHPAAARAVDAFVFFTIQLNLLVGAAAVLLVLKLNRSSTAFAVLRLSSIGGHHCHGARVPRGPRTPLDLKSWDAVGASSGSR
jgi:hypothetical protein